MQVFYRINENGLSWAGRVEKVGFPNDDPRFIPKEYLEKGEFIILSTSQGFGDWGIISAMPRLLKEKYKGCKVYIPSVELIKNMYGPALESQWGHWPEPERNAIRVFKNNPYIDGEIDTIKNEVFHDHYRIYNNENTRIPKVIQMLKFWRLEEKDYSDHLPEFYYSSDEIAKGDEIIDSYFGKNKFASINLSTTDIKRHTKEDRFYGGEKDKRLIEYLSTLDKDLEYVYWGDSIEGTKFEEYVNIKINLKDLDLPIRIQQYIRSKAIVNVGYVTSIFHNIPRYSKIVEVPLAVDIASNHFDNIKYLEE